MGKEKMQTLCEALVDELNINEKQIFNKEISAYRKSKKIIEEYYRALGITFDITPFPKTSHIMDNLGAIGWHATH
jgi:hypothetical protein